MELRDKFSSEKLALATDTEHEEPRPSFWPLIRDFCGYTSAHGFGRINASRHWIRTTFWILLCMAAVTMTTVQLHKLYKKYQSRLLTTLVEIETATNLPFPTVTFCNFNAIKKESLQEAMNNSEMQTLFKQLLEFENSSSSDSEAQNESFIDRRQRSNDFSDFVTTSLPTLESTTEYWSDDWPYHEEDEDTDDYDDEYEASFDDPAELDPSFLRREKIAVLMAKEDTRVLSKLGHHFEDMVLSCTYRGVSCRNESSKFWRKYWHYKYGNCFIFNSGKAAPVFKSNKPGPSHGLTLELNVEQDEYIGLLTPEAGIRMDISTQGEMPFPLERGISLSPGYATMIGLRKEIIIREDPFERRRCLKGVSKDESNLYTKHFGAVYSATACKESCLAYNQRQECGCTEYRFPGNDKRICNVSDILTMKCLGAVQRKFKENKLNCTKLCPPPCREEGFKTSSSFAIWPSEEHEPFYIDKYLLTKEGNHRKNICKVQVFYEELNLEVVKEQRSYEVVDFVSDIGGQLGLWIGFSVLTVAEFLELFALIFHTAINKFAKISRQYAEHDPKERV